MVINEIINLTYDPVTYRDVYGTVVVFPVREGRGAANAVDATIGRGNIVTMEDKEEGVVELFIISSRYIIHNLPEYRPGIAYIVYEEVCKLLRHRPDLFYVPRNTGESLHNQLYSYHDFGS